MKRNKESVRKNDFKIIIKWRVKFKFDKKKGKHKQGCLKCHAILYNIILYYIVATNGMHIMTI